MDRNRIAAALLLAVTAALPAWSQIADAGRVAEVAKRGGDVMPFDLMATIHVFTETGDGGVQRVVARNRGDAKQVQLVRQHRALSGLLREHGPAVDIGAGSDAERRLSNAHC